MIFRSNRKPTSRSASAAAWALAGVLGAALSAPGTAQDGYSREVVQAIPPAALDDLNGALRDLGRDPRNLSALMTAGQASLELGDPNAALGYFRRAEALAPNHGPVKAGLASAIVRLEDPVTAVQLFAQAEAAGTPMAEYAADRGLAHDLVGENVRAQQLYREALARENDPEVVRRLALSQAIMGDQRGSEATLLPLLQNRDLAAYRTRAFALAILGKSEEAVSIAETMLPINLSNRMGPYLRYMPRLTRAQQAAAANLGRFPRASEIGRDGPRISAYAGAAQPAAQPAAAARGPDSRLVPAGAPLGATGAGEAQAAASPRSTGGEVQVTYQPLPQPQPQPASNVPQPAAAPPQQSAQQQPVVVAAATDYPPPSPPPVQPAQDVPRPSLSIAAPAADLPDETVSLSEVFAAFSLPQDRAVRPARGAVDITAIQPLRERPKAEPPKPPAHPRRHWVQVATGRDTKALAFDWRRIQRTAGELLAGREGYTAEWGQTNRLVTGPYGSAGEAQKAVTALKEKGVDSFPYNSAEGEEVAPLK